MSEVIMSIGLFHPTPFNKELLGHLIIGQYLIFMTSHNDLQLF